MLTDEGVGMAALYWCSQFTWGDFRLRTRPRCTTQCSTLVAVLACLFFGRQIFLSLHFWLRDICVLELAMRIRFVRIMRIAQKTDNCNFEKKCILYAEMQIFHFSKGWLAIAKLKPLSLFILLLLMLKKVFDSVKIEK